MFDGSVVPGFVSEDVPEASSFITNHQFYELVSFDDLGRSNDANFIKSSCAAIVDPNYGSPDEPGSAAEIFKASCKRIREHPDSMKEECGHFVNPNPGEPADVTKVVGERAYVVPNKGSPAEVFVQACGRLLTDD